MFTERKPGFVPAKKAGLVVAAVSWWLLGGELPIVVGGALLLVWALSRRS